MIQKESLQFFGAYRRFGRANKNMKKQATIVCGVDMEELQEENVERPGFAELLVYMMLVSHRHTTTNVCWLSKRGCADKLALSPSTVHAAYKWLEKAKLIYLHDDNRLVRHMVKNGKGHHVNLYTIFDLPGYRWASPVVLTTGSATDSAPRYTREAQDDNEAFYSALPGAYLDEFDAQEEESEADEKNQFTGDLVQGPPIPDPEKKTTLFDSMIARELDEKAKRAKEEQEFQKHLEGQGQLKLLGGKDGQ